RLGENELLPGLIQPRRRPEWLGAAPPHRLDRVEVERAAAAPAELKSPPAAVEGERQSKLIRKLREVDELGLSAVRRKRAHHGLSMDVFNIRQDEDSHNRLSIFPSPARLEPRAAPGVMPTDARP